MRYNGRYLHITFMDLNTIFFIGPQGSGKGTQAESLTKRLGFYHWNMGAILRETATQDTELGKTVKDLIDQGILLNDQLLLDVAKAKLQTISPEMGVLFDGIPRRVGQAEFLMNFLKEQGRTNFVTIFLNIPKEESLNRLVLRARKEGRADDTKEAIELRLQQYHDDTVPVLDYLKKLSTFIEIDGTPSIEEVQKHINTSLGLES
jgi:adenylate kinase